MVIVDRSLVFVGTIIKVHGVKGLVKIKCFTHNPQDIEKYQPLYDQEQKQIFTFKIKSIVNDIVITAIDGINNRDQAILFKNTKLYALREKLPYLVDQEDYYQTDLIGLSVIDENGLLLGKIIACHNFGAGDFLEIREKNGSEIMIPFTLKAVPEIDLTLRQIRIESSYCLNQN
ncbi:MAG: ribosome maturation factor RimM [Alphaproteobacteria bacterium]|nr:ribosome maturation factor RimM [Alphaproteobacteria bacterium]